MGEVLQNYVIEPHGFNNARSLIEMRLKPNSALHSSIACFRLSLTFCKFAFGSYISGAERTFMERKNVHRL